QRKHSPIAHKARERLPAHLEPGTGKTLGHRSETFGGKAYLAAARSLLPLIARAPTATIETILESRLRLTIGFRFPGALRLPRATDRRVSTLSAPRDRQ